MRIALSDRNRTEDTIIRSILTIVDTVSSDPKYIKYRRVNKTIIHIKHPTSDTIILSKVRVASIALKISTGIYICPQEKCKIVAGYSNKFVFAQISEPPA